VPTFKELGFKEPRGLTWFAISGRPNLPPDIIAKMHREVNAAMRKPDIQAKLAKMGLLTQDYTVDSLRKAIEEETVFWKPVIERAGLVDKP
jgi:tripartite-type tricarboxylate transporter receptor subunit TctC